VLTKATVDALFAFSTPLSLDYTGLWLSSSSFEITITQLFPIQLESKTVQQIGSVAPTPARIYPAVGCATCVNAHEFVAYVRKEAALSNVPIACLPQFATSLPLDGDFGGAVVKIDYVIADDPGNVNDFYSPGDTITIVFNMATNMAGVCVSVCVCLCLSVSAVFVCARVCLCVHSCTYAHAHVHACILQHKRKMIKGSVQGGEDA